MEALTTVVHTECHDSTLAAAVARVILWAIFSSSLTVHVGVLQFGQLVSISLSRELNVDTKSNIDRCNVDQSYLIGTEVSSNTCCGDLVSSEVTSFITITVIITKNIREDVCTRATDRVSYVVLEVSLSV